MFNLKDILAALRFCVLGVLLFAPLTSNALPANDNHMVLCDATSATTLPEDGERVRSLSGQGKAVLSDRWRVFHGTDCDCWRVFQECIRRCDMEPNPGNCAGGCAMAHATCTMGCNGGMGP